MKQNTSWGKVANWYNEHLEGSLETYQEKIIKPNLLRILGPKAGMEILDVGCGQGFFSRSISAAGAKVVGIDLAGELIKLAKEQGTDRESYLVISAEKMTALKNSRFDAAVCVLALQNMKNMSAAILEISRILKPGGRCVIVLNHPTFRIPGSASWGFDTDTKIQYRRIDRYMSEITQEVDMTQGIKDTKNKKFTYTFHHPLQVYFKAFSKSGLSVTRLEEWTSHKQSDKGPKKQAEDVARKEIPLFLCLELIKN